MTKKYKAGYTDIVSLENLFSAWEEFIVGKRNREDVQEFAKHLADNVLSLHRDLLNRTYKHGPYEHFIVTDPKRRDIHKASVRDRLVHHALHRKAYPYFDKKFIHDIYSSRVGKGTHKAMEQFQSYGHKVSRNHTRTCWVLKCDIKKFFASIDHKILLRILSEHIVDREIFWLLKNIIESFGTCQQAQGKKGLPLGNLTSQLLVNIYMNEFDQHAKHHLKEKHYIRYADDFVFLSADKEELQDLIPQIENFLEQKLRLKLHPHKVHIKTFASGVDFLGWVHFPHHRVLRTTTKRRVIKNFEDGSEEAKQSYLGLLKRGDAYKLRKTLEP